MLEGICDRDMYILYIVLLEYFELGSQPTY